MRDSKSIIRQLPSILLLTATVAFADQTILDDLIVDGSACIGPECADGEEFGFDTLRLKGDELRMSFVDTSSSSSFPTNDWQITINDADSGSANRFSIDDLDAGTSPLGIEAGAPSHSLYLQANGRVGIGTPTPDANAALDVRGNLRVDGNVIVTGTIVGTAGVKAGIVPASAFNRKKASVTFETPYAGDYMVLLTAVTRRKTKTFRPTVLTKDTDGFTIAQGGKGAKHLLEVHWMTQLMGE